MKEFSGACSKQESKVSLPFEKSAKWAFAAMRQHKWRNAAERWEVLRRVYPHQPAVWIQAAISHRHLGELDEAEALLDVACKDFPNNANAFFQQAEVSISRGEWLQAQEFLHYNQRKFPEDIAAWVRIGDVYAMAGEKQKAYQVNELVRNKFESHPWPWIQYAEFAMQAGEYSLAMQRWEVVRQRFPEHAAGYRRAAAAAEMLGNYGLAKRLRAAQEYGNAWLAKFSDESETDTDLALALAQKVNPPQRRNWHMFLDLVWTKARLNLKSEASQNHLRYLWWILDPVLYMAVFYIVFGVLMERGGPGFIAYLLTGLVPFQWFAKTVQQTSGSILGGKGLMHKVRISPLFFPLVGIVQNMGKQLLVFAMLALFLVFYGLPPTIHWLAFIPVVLAQLLLMVVVSCLVAMIIPFIRDLSNLVPTGIQFLLFTSGIFYTVDRIPENWHTLFFSNPIANILFQYRQIFVENQWPVWSMLGWVVLGSLIGLGIVLWLYRKLEPIFPRVVLE